MSGREKFGREEFGNEAVEAAAKAIFAIRDDAYDMDEWEDLDSTDREVYECQARAALEAAAPHIQAEAQARAYDKGYTHGRHDEKYHPPMYLSGTPRLEKSRRNPYRALRQR